MTPRLERLMSLRQADPADADIPYMIAQEHARAGEHAQALPWFDACLDNDGDYHYARFHKAQSLRAIGRHDDATALLKDALPRAERSGDAKAAQEIAALLETVAGEAGPGAAPP